MYCDLRFLKPPTALFTYFLLIAGYLTNHVFQTEYQVELQH